MGVYKCRMCGDNLRFEPGATIAKCLSCFTVQSLPRLDDERRANLYERANNLWRNDEYDKAMGVYEIILQEDRADAEAYWSLVLCRYGVRYVEDPATRRRVPTINRAQFSSTLADADYKSALKYADPARREIYQREAREIDRIQRDILAISQSEPPFDVFICYKDTDSAGRRTRDSALAGEIYRELTREGLRVFYSRITLDDKLGSAYEPYIFAALNSSKVMLVVGTKPEYFNSVWMKNEWSRYLALMKSGARKALIPAYRDMDPYELPEEFSHLQALDMAKLGFMQDLLTGVKKLVAAPAQTAPPIGVNALMLRAQLALEGEDYSAAAAYVDKMLDIDPGFAGIYAIRLLIKYKYPTIAELADNCRARDALENRDFKRAVQYERGAGEYRRAYDAVAANVELCAAFERVNIDCRAQISVPELAARAEAELSRRAGDEFDDKATQAQYQAAAAQLKPLGYYHNADACRALCERLAALRGKNAAFAEQNAALLSALEAVNIKYGGKNIEELAERAVRELRRRAGENNNTDATRAQYEAAAAKLKPLGEYRRAAECAALCARLAQLRSESDKNRKAKIIASNKRAIAAGFSHTVGLKTDGTMVATGFKVDSRCDVGNWRNIVAVAAGKNHTLGLKADGTVVATGGPKYENWREVSGWRDITAIAAGESHTVGLKSDGTVAAYGTSQYGANLVSDWRDIIAIAAGGDNTVGLKSDGTVVVAGFSKMYQGIKNWRDIAQVAVGGLYVMGLKFDGTVVSEGGYAVDVSGWRNIVGIAARGQYALGLKSDGTVVATGNNDFGQCCVDDWRDIVEIAAHDTHCVGLKADGTVVATGSNNVGQSDVGGWRGIGAPTRAQVGVGERKIEAPRGLNANNTEAPRGQVGFDAGKVQLMTTARRGMIARLGGLTPAAKRAMSLRGIIGAGMWHTAGVKSDGTVVAAGTIQYGKCDVSGWRNIVAVAVGAGHIAGLTADGNVVATGVDRFGECDVHNWRDIVAIEAGSFYTLGLRADGRVIAAGRNEGNQIDVSLWRDIVAIAAGEEHAVGLKADGTLVTTGGKDRRSLDVSYFRNVVAIAAGHAHTAVLRSDGSVRVVGRNIFGLQYQTTSWRDIVAISIFFGHIAGLQADGRVVAVGEDDDKQCDVNGWRNIVAISAGMKHTVGLKSDGTLVAVGNNDNGQRNIAKWRGIGIRPGYSW